MAGKTGVPTQLIVQSKGVPSTMTMQQLQTMMKQQNIQNVSVSIFILLCINTFMMITHHNLFLKKNFKY